MSSSRKVKQIAGESGVPDLTAKARKVKRIAGGSWIDDMIALIQSIWEAGEMRDWQEGIAMTLGDVWVNVTKVATSTGANDVPPFSVKNKLNEINDDTLSGLATQVGLLFQYVEDKFDILLARPAGTVAEPSNANTQNLDNVAGSVWGAYINQYHSAGAMLSFAGWHAVRRLQEGIDWRGSTRFKLFYSFNYQWLHIEFHYPPRPDWGDIRLGDTRLTWLQRTAPQFTWQVLGWHDSPTAYTLETNLARFYLDLTEAEFNLLKSVGSTGLQLAGKGYPGPSLVTWGTPVPFADHIKVDAATYGVGGRMDGVLLDITVIPGEVGHQQIEDVWRYFRLGWLVFEDEDANTDRVQFLGPHQAVFVPEAFVGPANVVVSCKPGVSGTITPWVVTP